MAMSASGVGIGIRRGIMGRGLIRIAIRRAPVVVPAGSYAGAYGTAPPRSAGRLLAAPYSRGTVTYSTVFAWSGLLIDYLPTLPPRYLHLFCEGSRGALGQEDPSQQGNRGFQGDKSP